MKKSIIIVSILMLLPFSGEAVEYGFYGRGKDKSFHTGMYETTHTYGRGQQNRLGLSSELSISRGKQSFGSASGLGGQADVVYIKTGGTKTSDKNYSASFSSGLPQMAKTTMTNDYENGEVSIKGFLEPPGYSADSPVGDAIMPLLLFLLPLVLYKIKFSRTQNIS